MPTEVPRNICCVCTILYVYGIVVLCAGFGFFARGSEVAHATARHPIMARTFKSIYANSSKYTERSLMLDL